MAWQYKVGQTIKLGINGEKKIFFLAVFLRVQPYV